MIKHEFCTGCSACENICPVDAIQMEADDEGFDYPRILPDRCVHCNACNVICDDVRGCAPNRTSDGLGRMYAGYAKDLRIRLKSSSGGVFSLLAERSIAASGGVYGAQIDENLEVVHAFLHDEEGLTALRQSKYVQSRIGKTFRKIREDLAGGKNVVFSGTPCQVAGLKAFLGAEQENLLSVDFVCHGVPSPKLWRIYLKWLEKRFGAPVANVEFRNKRTGWRQYSLSYGLGNGKTRHVASSEDAFMRLFLSDRSLRPSCYHCRYKVEQSAADLTLADFWACDKVTGRYDDNQGVSLVFAHTDKGELALKGIAKDMVLWEQPMTADTLRKCNRAALESPALPAGRGELFDAIRTLENPDTVFCLPKVPYALKFRTIRAGVKRKLMYSLIRGRRIQRLGGEN